MLFKISLVYDHIPEVYDHIPNIIFLASFVDVNCSNLQYSSTEQSTFSDMMVFKEVCLASPFATQHLSFLTATEQELHYPVPVTLVALLWVLAVDKTMVGYVVAVPLSIYPPIWNFSRHIMVPPLWLLSPSWGCAQFSLVLTTTEKTLPNSLNSLWFPIILFFLDW